MTYLTILLSALLPPAHAGLILIAVGIALRLFVAQRRFRRRGMGGLQHFSNYYVALVILLLEFFLKWTGTGLIIFGLLKLIVKF